MEEINVNKLASQSILSYHVTLHMKFLHEFKELFIGLTSLDPHNISYTDNAYCICLSLFKPSVFCSLAVVLDYSDVRD
ncbi:MAG: hypothetical protein QW775_06820 [Ignisphaera sp.]|uniref:Uncharacterized protein n=1 Tax=Ignisphaera aggregans TaxID=334771 RepID=A0A7C4JIT6_9CREN